MVSSIQKFAQEISHQNIVKTHAEKRRVRTIDRSVTNTAELEQRQAGVDNGGGHAQDGSWKPFTHSVKFSTNHRAAHGHGKGPVRSGMAMLKRVRSRKPKLVLLQEEKDRFNAMRNIQRSTSSFKKYSALTMSVIACKS